MGEVLISQDRLFRKCSKCPIARMAEHTYTCAHNYTQSDKGKCRDKNSSFSLFKKKMIQTHSSDSCHSLLCVIKYFCSHSLLVLDVFLSPWSQPCCWVFLKLSLSMDLLFQGWMLGLLWKTTGKIETINLLDRKAWGLTDPLLAPVGLISIWRTICAIGVSSNLFHLEMKNFQIQYYKKRYTE